MNPEWHAVAAWPPAIIAITSAVFFAGGFFWMVKQYRRNLNGLGKRVTQLEKSAEERYLALCFALLVLCPAEKRQEIAALLQNWKKP